MSIEYWGFLKMIRENPAYLIQIFPGFVSDDVESVLGAEKLEIPTSKALSDKWHGERLDPECMLTSLKARTVTRVSLTMRSPLK